jgi:hypothetical protein
MAQLSLSRVFHRTDTLSAIAHASSESLVDRCRCRLATRDGRDRHAAAIVAEGELLLTTHALCFVAHALDDLVSSSATSSTSTHVSASWSAGAVLTRVVPYGSIVRMRRRTPAMHTDAGWRVVCTIGSSCIACDQARRATKGRGVVVARASPKYVCVERTRVRVCIPDDHCAHARRSRSRSPAARCCNLRRTVPLATRCDVIALCVHVFTCSDDVHLCAQMCALAIDLHVAWRDCALATPLQVPPTSRRARAPSSASSITAAVSALRRVVVFDALSPLGVQLAAALSGVCVGCAFALLFRRLPVTLTLQACPVCA